MGSISAAQASPFGFETVINAQGEPLSFRGVNCTSGETRAAPIAAYLPTGGNEKVIAVQSNSIQDLVVFAEEARERSVVRHYLAIVMPAHPGPDHLDSKGEDWRRVDGLYIPALQPFLQGKSTQTAQPTGTAVQESATRPEAGVSPTEFRESRITPQDRENMKLLSDMQKSLHQARLDLHKAKLDVLFYKAKYESEKVFNANKS